MAAARDQAVQQGLSVADDAPAEVKERAERPPRAPNFDPTLGIEVERDVRGKPVNRLVAIGDSLTHGFQSGAIFNTDISYPATIAYELGWADEFRHPRYGGPGGLPLNIELLLRRLEKDFGPTIGLAEIAMALFAGRGFMDSVEDYWERGPGHLPPVLSAYNHALAVYGWDLRDALSLTFDKCEKRIHKPKDSLLKQVVENANDRAATYVYPDWPDEAKKLTLFDAARELGADHDDRTDSGIETLIVFLGANNALRTVVELNVVWSKDDFADLNGKKKYTVWCPSHFAAEFAEVVAAVKKIEARHVIFATVPHVTIPPISRGIGEKVKTGSRYFPYYARPWVSTETFDEGHDKHITGRQARAIDFAIDMYNETIEAAVRDARRGTDGVPRDWYLLDASGLLDRMATRRYIEDPSAQPEWWTPYELPPALKALAPTLDSRFLTSDGHGGRKNGGLFSLDGVHPTTVCYGVVAQEIINIMRKAGVEFFHPNHEPRQDPITVDFDRLIGLDTLVRRPPQNVGPGLAALGWADERLDWIKRTLTFSG